MGTVSVQLLFIKNQMYNKYFFEDWFGGHPDSLARRKVFAGRKIKAAGITAVYMSWMGPPSVQESHV